MRTTPSVLTSSLLSIITMFSGGFCEHSPDNITEHMRCEVSLVCADIRADTSRVSESETPSPCPVDFQISRHVLANQIDAIFLSFCMFFFFLFLFCTLIYFYSTVFAYVRYHVLRKSPLFLPKLHINPASCSLAFQIPSANPQPYIEARSKTSHCLAPAPAP